MVPGQQPAPTAAKDGGVIQVGPMSPVSRELGIGVKRVKAAAFLKRETAYSGKAKKESKDFLDSSPVPGASHSWGPSSSPVLGFWDTPVAL